MLSIHSLCASLVQHPHANELKYYAAQKKKKSFCDMNTKKGRMNQQSVVTSVQHFCPTNHLASDEIFYTQKSVAATMRKKSFFIWKMIFPTISTVFGRWASAKMIDNGVELRSSTKCSNSDTIKKCSLSFQSIFFLFKLKLKRHSDIFHYNERRNFSFLRILAMVTLFADIHIPLCGLFSHNFDWNIRNTMEIGHSK